MSILDADDRHAHFSVDTDLTSGLTSISVGPDTSPERLGASLRLLADHFTASADSESRVEEFIQRIGPALDDDASFQAIADEWDVAAYSHGAMFALGYIAQIVYGNEGKE